MSPYKTSAREVFGGTESDWVLELAYHLKMKLPKRVGGHDKDRGKDGAKGQVGGDKSASDHGKNQGNQWAAWKKEVLAAAKKRNGGVEPTDARKAKDLIKKLEEEEG